MAGMGRRPPGDVSRLMLYGGWATGWPSATRRASDLCSGCWPRTGDWDRTCSPISSTRRRRRHPSPRALPARRILGRDGRRVVAARLRPGRPLGVAPVQAPTLVLHRHGDRAAPIDEGRALAASITGAELWGSTAAHTCRRSATWSHGQRVRRFLGLPRLRRAVPTGLTTRQEEVAALVAEGLTNRELADRLDITERSAESHSSGSAFGSASGPAPRWPPGMSRSTRTGEVVPRLRRGRSGAQHGGMTRRPAFLFPSGVAWLGSSRPGLDDGFPPGVMVPRTVDGPARTTHRDRRRCRPRPPAALRGPALGDGPPFREGRLPAIPRPARAHVLRGRDGPVSHRCYWRFGSPGATRSGTSRPGRGLLWGLSQPAGCWRSRPLSPSITARFSGYGRPDGYPPGTRPRRPTCRSGVSTPSYGTR